MWAQTHYSDYERLRVGGLASQWPIMIFFSRIAVSMYYQIEYNAKIIPSILLYHGCTRSGGACYSRSTFFVTVFNINKTMIILLEGFFIFITHVIFLIFYPKTIDFSADIFFSNSPMHRHIRAGLDLELELKKWVGVQEIYSSHW